MGTRIALARALAAHMHQAQQYGDKPYTYHLQQVVNVLISVNAHEDLICAGWLHDALEDTALPAVMLLQLFGSNVLHLVRTVTSPVGSSRKDRYATQYPIIAQHYDATVLKLADRIANVESGGKLDMYRREHAAFRAALYTPGNPVTDLLWERLDHAIQS
jgi:(p)ppGpp synthase/HD superfamily hydrolase